MQLRVDRSRCLRRHPRHALELLFVDGDLQETAANLGVLTTAVLDGTADMTIATLPAQITAGGREEAVQVAEQLAAESDEPEEAPAAEPEP